jgi:hypothetical protein
LVCAPSAASIQKYKQVGIEMSLSNLPTLYHQNSQKISSLQKYKQVSIEMSLSNLPTLHHQKQP